VGEPDFTTPEYIKLAAHQAIDNNFTRYTASAGILDLRQAIIAKLKRDNGLDYQLTDILVTPGGKPAIIDILLATCDPGDEVLIPSPYWVSYPAQVGLCDGIPVSLDTDESTNFKITAVQLEKTLAGLKKPKALILNSPNNPTGAVYSRAELAEIGAVCLKYNLLIISDEIYEKLVYDNIRHHSIASIPPRSKPIR
jgi:aspartate aminotransferase